MKKYAIIVAGGKGLRMGAALPKQFLLLNGKPVLMHTIETFRRYDKQLGIILVLPEDQIEYWNELVEEYCFDIEHTVTPGGTTRFHSVKNGLARMKEEAMIAIHDGVRALITSDLITRVFAALENSEGAYPVIPVSDTLRKWDSRTETYVQVDREQFRLVQTPQAFHSRVLVNAYNVEYSEEFTDDVSVVGKTHPDIRIATVEGSSENIKITKPEDLVIASAILKCRT